MRRLFFLLGTVLFSGLGNSQPTASSLTDLGIAPQAQPVAAALPMFPQAPTVYWDQRPIPITLQVGVERQIHFPAGVRLGIPAQVNHALRTQSVAGTVHWLASEPFKPVRVQVREIDSGRTYLLDVGAAAEGGDVGAMTIAPRPPAQPLIPQSANALGSNSVAQEYAPVGTLDDLARPKAYDYPTLTRFAFAQLHAPERLLPELTLAGVERTPVPMQPIPYLYQGGALVGAPLGGWSDGQTYITALQLTNTTTQTVLVDPRAIRGRWLARGLIQAELQPKGDAWQRDRTIIVLLSPVPFQEALP